MSGNASRLVVRNLDLGREDHYDLGSAFTPVSDYERDFAAKYSVGEREVMFIPAYADAFGRGPHAFYSTQGGEVRQIQVGSTAAELIAEDATPEIGVPAQSSASVLLASSVTGYFVERLRTHVETGSATHEFTRREFQHDPENGRIVEAWSRELDLTRFYGRQSLSGHGEWLAVHAWNFQVLDTATGETIFEYPWAGDRQPELARLANVTEPGATVADLGGKLGGWFLEDELLISRRFGSVSACSGDLAQYDQCVAELRQRGIYRTVLDVFDMSNIDLDSQPDFRIDYNSDSQCEAGEFPLRGLQVHDGALTFLTIRR